MSTASASIASRPRPNLLWRLAACVAALAGGLLMAYFVHQLMSASLRYFVAVILGVSFLSLAMIYIRRLPEVLLYLLVLSIPVMTFEKTFLHTDKWVDFGTPGINVGLFDVLLAGLYATWFVEIFILHRKSLPRLTWLDGCVFAYVLATAASLITSHSRLYTFFELLRVGKYALGYFYVAHNLRRIHLKPLLWMLLLALVLESGLGVFQHRTGKLVGIARSKGAATAELSSQYEVPEFEGHRRAEGTTIDSHAMGVYMCLLLMFPFCLALCRWMAGRDRLLFAAMFLIGVPGLIATFSRGGWGACAIGVGVVLAVFFLWKERRAIGVFLVLCLVAAPAVLIGGGSLLGKRIFRAPSEIMEARWDTMVISYEIWRQAPLTGGGANAYFHAQRDLGLIYDLSNDKPGHNLVIYLLSQTGLLGVVTYYVIGAVVLVYCIRLIRRQDPLLSPLALAVLAGLIALQADGAIDFMSFTNQVYFMQFLLCGLVAGMWRLASTEPSPGFVDIKPWAWPKLADFNPDQPPALQALGTTE